MVYSYCTAVTQAAVDYTVGRIHGIQLSLESGQGARLHLSVLIHCPDPVCSCDPAPAMSCRSTTPLHSKAVVVVVVRARAVGGRWGLDISNSCANVSEGLGHAARHGHGPSHCTAVACSTCPVTTIPPTYVRRAVLSPPSARLASPWHAGRGSSSSRATSRCHGR